MKNTNIITVALVALSLPLTGLAQRTINHGATPTTPREDANLFTAAGAWEFTLGGSGASSKDFDDSYGGVNFSVGYYLNDTMELSVRQGINYSNPDSGGSAWDGSTLVAFDWHLTPYGALRPFIGANFGGLYGDTTNDSWAAGLEAGAKYYVKPQTFVYALINYAWLFNEPNDINDRFDDGAFLWSAGIGFDF